MSHPTAPGMGWETPRTYMPGPAPTHDDWNSLVQQVARLSRPQGSGLFNSVGNFPDSDDSGDVSSVAGRWLKTTSPVLAGTWDYPFKGSGKFLVWSLPSEKFELSTENVVFYNPFPNLSAVSDALVFVAKYKTDPWIMIWGSC